MKLSIGFSPCPNDTFIFDAWLHERIDTEGLELEAYMADVEELNRLAFAGELQLSKLSYHAYLHCSRHYVLLRAGSALGRGCGPLLIAREPLSREALLGGKIAIPGKYTTANLLLSVAYPELREEQKEVLLFSEIEEALLAGKVDAGLIIHENRFTYQDLGLHALCDLGEFWEQKTGAAIPLGGIVGQKTLGKATLAKAERVLRRSVEYAFAHPQESLPYTRQHAQAMSEAVMQQHIALYVNEFSLDLGEEGLAAIRALRPYAPAGFQLHLVEDM